MTKYFVVNYFERNQISRNRSLGTVYTIEHMVYLLCLDIVFRLLVFCNIIKMHVII